MNTFPIDPEWFSASIAAVLPLEPNLDYRTQEQRLSPDGVPQWTLSVLLSPEDQQNGLVEISIASPTEPKFVEGVIPRFDGLRARFWQSNRNGRQSAGLMVTAEAVHFDSGRAAEPVAA